MGRSKCGVYLAFDRPVTFVASIATTARIPKKTMEEQTKKVSFYEIQVTYRLFVDKDEKHTVSSYRLFLAEQRQRLLRGIA